jgi:hypothetical protein
MENTRELRDRMSYRAMSTPGVLIDERKWATSFPLDDMHPCVAQILVNPDAPNQWPPVMQESAQIWPVSALFFTTWVWRDSPDFAQGKFSDGQFPHQIRTSKEK